MACSQSENSVPSWVPVFRVFGGLLEGFGVQLCREVECFSGSESPCSRSEGRNFDHEIRVSGIIPRDQSRSVLWGVPWSKSHVWKAQALAKEKAMLAAA